MINTIKYLVASRYRQCVQFHGGHSIPRGMSCEFKDFHRGQEEMYARYHFRCAHCNANVCLALRLPQDFTDRCDQTYPHPWFSIEPSTSLETAP